MELNPALFVLPQEEERHGISNLIYGSLTTRGLHTMVKTIMHYFPNPDIIEGMDLGCGDGELLYHLQTLLPGSRWEGVEIAASRVEKQRRPVLIGKVICWTRISGITTSCMPITCVWTTMLRKPWKPKYFGNFGESTFPTERPPSFFFKKPFI